MRRHGDAVTAPDASKRRPGPVFWLLSGQVVMFTGIAAIFPIAPLYVAAHGGGPIVIALFIAGPLLANTLVQVPAGRLCDRIGRRPLLIGARIAFGLLSIGLFIDAGPLWLLTVLRLLQGLTSGAYVPALRAALTDLSDEATRGRRFAQLQACEMVGLLVGPLLGGSVALWRLSGVFGVAGLAVLAGPALLIVAATAATYPFLRELSIILMVGTIEAIAVVAIEPSLFAVIGDTAPADMRGRAMGVGGLFEAAGLTFGAAGLGSLYG